jgi:hypothetical protein
LPSAESGISKRPRHPNRFRSFTSSVSFTISYAACDNNIYFLILFLKKLLFNYYLFNYYFWRTYLTAVGDGGDPGSGIYHRPNVLHPSRHRVTNLFILYIKKIKN